MSSGVKASFLITNARTRGGQFIVGTQVRPSLPYEGHTLQSQIALVEHLTGTEIERSYIAVTA
ncbi:hypothetical protein [Mesorhizobium sp. M0118]|uniref:hypothetical protein n=1 Tax=Mesorhizobium sp. M0118 TaxID=2956884 RepID=UPI00333C88AD